ncbi:MAG: hypothetical protein KDA32_03995 [Phycisphaerales bacterium]|nr:hypothetical protein [Phycisphaerales bacterium]
MPRRGDHCRVCGRGFAAGDHYRALLFETEQGYEREEVCLGCPPHGDDFLASWRTHRPHPTGPQKVRLDLPAIFSFFEGLADATEPEKVQFRFVLALLLWRKKALRLQDSNSADGVETWHFTRPKSEDRYQVARPALDDQRIEELSAQLEALLAGGESPEGAEAPPETEGPSANAEPEALEAGEPR